MTLFRHLKRHRVPFYIVIALSLCGLAFTQAQLNDKDVTRAIETALIVEPGVKAHNINTETQNGIVTLTGVVNNILAQERATKIAENVKGVRAVINRIKVEPTVWDDARIEDAVEDALLVNPATESHEIDASVVGGILTLTGQVESWREKQLAETVAKGVRGIREVNNNIRVTPPETRPDLELQKEIDEALRWDIRVDDALVNVKVENGKATLSGTVGSAAEKTQAIYDAWVHGVTSVDATGLTVKGWARDPDLRKAKYEFVSDEKIEQAIEDAFYQDARVLSYEPNITVEGGVVTLSGTVKSYMSKRAAEEDARNVVGVYRVKNFIKVRPDGEPPLDTTLTSRVERKIQTDPYLDTYDIDISTFNGEVTLWGAVDTDFERRRAGNLASQVDGVVTVDNRISAKEPSVFYFYADKSDWEIQEDIQDELFWSPFVNSDEINVKVEDGVATLTGIVDTWSERVAARRNAVEGGALSVDNNILVRSGPEFYRPGS